MTNILCPECKHNMGGNCMRQDGRFIDVVMARVCADKWNFFEKKEVPNGVKKNGKKRKKK